MNWEEVADKQNADILCKYQGVKFPEKVKTPKGEWDGSKPSIWLRARLQEIQIGKLNVFSGSRSSPFLYLIY